VDPKALVLGGGAAGLTAALTLARHGFHTYLVERQPHLGGLARRLFFTLAGFDPQEFLHDLQSQAFRHPNIEVLAHAELVKVSGHVGRFSSLVRQRTPAGVKERTLTHGVILAATGGEEFSPLGRFLYGADHRVITQQELEAKIHGQHLDLPQVRQVVMIQCVGSREPERPYCSRVCCAQALKNALLLKARYPLADIAILYRDIRAYGFKERYYQEAKERGVRFLPFEPERPPRVEARRRRPLTVWVWDELLGAEAPLAADLVVLSAGLKPAPDARQVAQRLKIPLSADGFFLEAHQKLRPVDAAADGVFLCGLAHSPQSLAEAVTQARAAAMRAAALLYQPELWHGEVIAAIRPGQCRQCLTCLRCCPFGAVHLGPGRSPEIIPELCQGCGVCLAECPYGAIDVNRGGEAEVLAQMAAALR
jgi:heterodisulfide reductase subunit A